MNAVPFDTLKMAQRLEAAGFPASHAAGASEALAEALVGADLATKADVAATKTDLKADIAATKTELKADIAAAHAAIAALEAKMLAAMAILQRDMTIKLGSFMFVAVGVLLAAMRYMTLHP
jgi:hypothetical protein